MKTSSPTKTFFLGLAVSVLILVSFLGGAIADRVFVIKPLDYFSGKINLPASQNRLRSEEGLRERTNSQLGTLLAAQTSVADVAEVASESVVTVAVKQTETVFDSSSMISFGFFTLPQSRLEEVQRDIGTGFIVSHNGLVATNKHVVTNTKAEYLIIDKDNNEYSVSDIYLDPSNDLAIIKANDFSGQSLPLGDSDQLRVGEEVIAIGTALGEFRHTVTTGVISGLGRGVEAIDAHAGQIENLEGLIQTDAAINSGNSGGPLLSRSGQVIGVNVAVSAGAENIGFALPINLVKASLQNFQATGSFERAFLGVTYRNITAEAALVNEVPQGAYVVTITPASAAEQAGLEPGDIVTDLDGQSLKDVELAEIVNQLQIGQQVELKYWRDGEASQTNVTLQAQE